MTQAQQRRRLVLGNWKMNGGLAANGPLLSAVRQGWNQSSGSAACDVGVCVPFPYLAQAESTLTGSDVAWGSQDISVHASGAYTGEVSAAMLQDFGCRYAIVGHSERRAYHGETSQQVADKAKAALAGGLVPVVCVGETLAERDEGRMFSVIGQQLAPVLALGADSVSRMVLAYEPVWAIGTGKTASPEQAQEVHAFIRTELAKLGCQGVRVLYGGSCKASNAATLFGMPDIDGGLIGGAALVADEFLSIAAAGALPRSV